VFEYLFFKLVVNKYKILDKKTLLCNLAKKWNKNFIKLNSFFWQIDKSINIYFHLITKSLL
jgi:hypothetical protein